VEQQKSHGSGVNSPDVKTAGRYAGGLLTCGKWGSASNRTTPRRSPSSSPHSIDVRLFKLKA
jgi:hypothetical protein